MESQCSSSFSVSQDSSTQIPKVGHIFESLKEASAFYNQYAREVGFSARIKKIKSRHQKRCKIFVCSEEGKTKTTTHQPKHEGSISRAGERKRKRGLIGCKARLSLLKQLTGEGWEVRQFVEEHNHALTNPSEVQMLRSHSAVSAKKNASVQQFVEESNPTCQQLQSTDIDASDSSLVRSDENDALEEERAHDTETLIEFLFPTEKEKSLSFFYDYETDSDNKLIRCLWADPESRRSYSVFGDVIELDTFYHTNKYSMIFVTFTGVNHHCQTIVFACGLLSDESIESFVWLFSKFIEAMPNRAHPGVIITHEDTMISNALSKVLPFTFHRYSWQRILDVFSRKINGMSCTQQYRDLVNIIKQSQSPEEFERRWNQVVETTNLRRDEWLSRMYNIRSQWVHSYVRRVFRAGMCRDQNPDSGLSFFKERVKENDTLMGLVIRFNRALAHQRRLELMADLSEPSTERCWHVMQKQMVKIYTRRIFLLFHKEVDLCSSYVCHKIASSVNAKVYHIERFESGQVMSQKVELTHNLATDLITCSCRLFEFIGVPCGHMLCYMNKKQVMILPDKYILQRWTKNAKTGLPYHPIVGKAKDDGSSGPFMRRRDMLDHMFSELVDEACLTPARTNFLLGDFERLRKGFKEIDEEGNIGMKMKSSEKKQVRDLDHSRAKEWDKQSKSSTENSFSERL